MAARAADIAAAPSLNLMSGWTIDEAYLLECYLNELNQRQGEALAIYRCVPGAMEYHQSLAGENGVRGSNRAGKTLLTCAEDAMAATGQHFVEGKYRDPPLEIALVGPGERHLRLLYRMLFRPGQFKVIQDADGTWRVPDYETPADVARLKEWQDGPPLIPERMVETESWIDKKAEEPALVRLVNGSTFYFFSYDSEPPPGVFFHRVHMDEEHPRARVWLTEMRARVMSVGGRLDWSATPENATPVFYGLQARALRPDMPTLPAIKQTKFFNVLAKNNPFIPADAREAFEERLREDDPEAAVAKVEGEWAFRKLLIYPEFDENRHLIDAFEIAHEDSLYIVVDPGITRCAMLMATVVSPDSKHFLPQWPDRLILIDEALIQNCQPWKAADKLRKMLDRHQHWLQHVVFDLRHGRKRESDDDGTIASKYWDAFKKAGIHPRIDRIVWGGDNFADGIVTVKSFLDPASNLPPRLVAMRGRCPWWQWEIQKYQRRRDPNDKQSPGKVHRKKDDLMDCTRYLCVNNPQWVTPPGTDHKLANAYSAEELRQMERNPIVSLYGHRYQRSR